MFAWFSVDIFKSAAGTETFSRKNYEDMETSKRFNPLINIIFLQIVFGTNLPNFNNNNILMISHTIDFLRSTIPQNNISVLLE